MAGFWYNGAMDSGAGGRCRSLVRGLREGIKIAIGTSRQSLGLSTLPLLDVSANRLIVFFA
jgi:hypothetical protein